MVSGNDDAADRPDTEPGSEAASSGGGKQPESEFGPSLGDFGPSLNEFGPAPAAPAPGWTPAPGPQSPDLAWRPAEGGVPPQYRAPDSWTPVTGQYPPVTGGQFPVVGAPHTGQFPVVGGGPYTGPAPVVGDVEQTVNFRAETPDPEQTTRIPDAAPAADPEAGSWWRSAPSGFPPVPPPETPGDGESLAWSDDPIAQALAPKTVVPQAKPKEAPPWGRIGAIAGGVVGVLAVTGLVVFMTTGGGDGRKDETPVAGGATTLGNPKSAAPTTAAALSCPAKQDGSLTIGNGPGGTGSGPDAIMAFEHAFYVERSGVKAREVVAPDSATVATADIIQQQGIDPTKAGTTYCLQINGIGPELYDVDLTEHRPDGTTKIYGQRITTVVRDGKHLILSIDYPP
ncbi:hypothetical protein [Nocardia sp. NBC_00511]|uniref:hypothetical protein n=1 Tax=Nocardia sp. NBC_00511 TaxID=2903591 RepID=UPI0030E418DD